MESLGLDLDTALKVGGLAVNAFIAFMMLRMKLEIAEVKLWILENFERRSNKRE